MMRDFITAKQRLEEPSNPWLEKLTLIIGTLGLIAMYVYLTIFANIGAN